MLQPARAAVVLLVVLAASTIACKKDQSTAPYESASDAPASGRLVVDAKGLKSCELPMSAYCKNNSCVAFADAVIAAHALSSGSSPWSNADVGTCGSARYVHRAAWYMSQIEYFDAAGKLIGAQESVDNLSQFCAGKTGSARYGKTPTCAMAATEIVLDGGLRIP